MNGPRRLITWHYRGKQTIRNYGFSIVTALLIMVLGAAPCALGQVIGGTISGRVTDPARAPIVGAQVIIGSQAKGELQTVTTNESGYYRVPNLVPGNYDLTVSASGFATEVQKNLTVEVGQEKAVNVALRVGDVNQQVEVTADIAAVNSTSATVSNVVNGQTVRDLPINGRDWTLLAALEPGVHTIEAQSTTAGGGGARANRGYGTEMTIAGNRPQQNNYRLDGVSVNDYSGGGPGNVLGSALGVDAVQEFSVITGNVTADYGRTSGGVINAITRSGQNQVHGSAYEFLRNSALDARNFFDGPQIPPFKRNQFGGSIGGPIYLPGYNGKSKSFFFFDYEGLRQDLGTTTLINVPSRAARNGQVSGGNITVDALVRPFLAMFPLPNGSENGDIGFYSFSSQSITKENLYTFRLDHKFSDFDSLFGTFLADLSKNQNPDAYNFVLVGQVSARKLISIEETHIFRPNLINVSRVGYSRSVADAPFALGGIHPLATDPSLGFIPGDVVGTIQITGITVFNGGVGSLPESRYHYGSYQAYDDLLYSRRNHSFKFGTAVEHIQSNELNTGDIGRYVFGSVRSFLLNQPTSFNASIPGGVPTFYVRQTVFGAYVQEDYRVHPNLTLNLGLRYEMATVPTEKHNHLTNLPDLTSNQVQIGSPYFRNPTLRNLSPRLGFAWDPFKDGKSSLRAAFGIYDTLPLTYQFELLVVNANPFSPSGNVTSPTLPTGSFPTGGFPRLTSNTLRYSYIQPNPKRSYVQQWNFNLQRRLPYNTVLLLGYIGEHGVHQPFRTNDANIVPPSRAADGSLFWPTPRGSGITLNPNAGSINAIAWIASNTYHGMNIGLTRQTQRLRAGLSYTWSKSLDNSSASITGGTFTTGILSPFLFFPQFFRGLSDFDVRHNLTFNYLLEMPQPRFAKGAVLKRATNGWQLGGIFRASTGLPFTVTTGGDPLGLKNFNPFNFPDRVNTPDCTNPVNPGEPTHYIRTECFIAPVPGTRLGNGGRNRYEGPGIRNFDVSLIKNNRFGERFSLQFRAEFFNVLNHANFAVPDRTSAQLFSFNASNNSFARVQTAGSLNSTSTTSRQIQFALKLAF